MKVGDVLMRHPVFYTHHAMLRLALAVLAEAVKYKIALSPTNTFVSLVYTDNVMKEAKPQSSS